MFVTAVLESPVGPAGEALAKSEAPRAPLVIPDSAPLITGKRAVVYVEVKPGTYRGREVVLGPRVGEFYVVREGLREGERVVTHGAFKIDSALQIQARPSMMSPEGGGAASGHAHGGPGGPSGHGGHGEAAGQATTAASRAKKGELPPVERLKVPKTFRLQLAAVTKAYYSLHHALSRDDLARAKIAAATVATAVRTVQGGLLRAEARKHWQRLARSLEDAATALKGASELAVARRHFAPLSNALIEAVRRFGLDERTPAIRFRCTMAFNNQGADWLQKAKGVENPYYGSQMFRCGDNKGELAPGGGRM
jgi:Cu(I)/Ag(I) efflux system membrane fusion protein